MTDPVITTVAVQDSMAKIKTKTIAATARAIAVISNARLAPKTNANKFRKP